MKTYLNFIKEQKLTRMRHFTFPEVGCNFYDTVGKMVDEAKTYFRKTGFDIFARARVELNSSYELSIFYDPSSGKGLEIAIIKNGKLVGAEDDTFIYIEPDALNEAIEFWVESGCSGLSSLIRIICLKSMFGNYDFALEVIDKIYKAQ
jgi:hypothetical protein